jgi:Putative DNA-binding domain
VWPLAEVQGAFARAVLAGDAGVVGLPAFVGRIPPEVAFSVHQSTVLGALTKALRLIYPTVDSLVGAEFFDHAALAFIAVEPPRTANLSAYGDGYPAFLATFAAVRELPYLPDVATLDLAIDRAQRARDAPPRRVPIDINVALEIPATLNLLRLDYPADNIRAAIDADDSDALGTLDMTVGTRFVAVWPSSEGAAVRRLGSGGGSFLEALMNGLTSEEAVAAATGERDVTTVLADIEAEVFRAPFTTIVPFAED